MNVLFIDGSYPCDMEVKAHILWCGEDAAQKLINTFLVDVSPTKRFGFTYILPSLLEKRKWHISFGTNTKDGLYKELLQTPI